MSPFDRFELGGRLRVAAGCVVLCSGVVPGALAGDSPPVDYDIVYVRQPRATSWRT